MNDWFALRLSAAALLVALPSAAQNWEFGGAAGFGFYRDVSLSGPGGSGRAGFGPRFALGAVVGRSLGEHFSVEGRCTFQDGDLEIKSGSTKADLDGDASSFLGEFSFWPLPRRARIRPYVAAGVGTKLYRGTQDPAADEPLMDLAVMHHATQAVGLVTYGGGVKVRLTPRWLLRLDFRDYTTPFPAHIMSPAPGVRAGGWIHDFVPMLGVSWGG